MDDNEPRQGGPQGQPPAAPSASIDHRTTRAHSPSPSLQYAIARLWLQDTDPTILGNGTGVIP